MIEQLRDTFNSRTKALEVLYLLKDLKPVVRHGFYQHELDKVKKFCERNKLAMEISPYKVILEGKQMFSNKGRIVDTTNKQGMFLVYISKDQMKALWANLYETRQDHLNTGLALGYPQCCAGFFVEQFNDKNVNPVHKPTNPWTNLTKRDDDICLLSHFPCSSECEPSKVIAIQSLELIKKYDNKLAELFYEKLSVD
jgi:hypothetical protein